jgi:hypothetical protein
VLVIAALSAEREAAPHEYGARVRSRDRVRHRQNHTIDHQFGGLAEE